MKKSTVIFPCSFTAFRVNFQRSPIWALNLYFEKSKTTAVFKNQLNFTIVFSLTLPTKKFCAWLELAKFKFSGVNEF